jgi:hypothetical protein
MTEAEASEYDIFMNKKTDKLYMSKSLETTQFRPDEVGGVMELSRRFRIQSKVFECEDHQFIKHGKELVLRISQKARQEIVAKFYEDTRSIFTLQIQRFSSPSGIPHQIHFSFGRDEIVMLYNFIRNIAI